MLSGLFNTARQRMFRGLYRSGYRSLVGSGQWQQALVGAVALDPQERIVEVCCGVEGVCADLVTRYPLARVSCVQVRPGAGKAVPAAAQLNFLDGRMDCDPASFDKAICTLALHVLPAAEKLKLLREIRRVLRHNGTLYVVELDQGKKPHETLLLRAAATQFGAASVCGHLDGSWLNLLSQAGFTSLKRLEDFSLTIGRMALIRARRA